MKWLQRRISRRARARAGDAARRSAPWRSAGYVLATQLDDLTTQLGKYTESMRRKVAALQESGGGPLARVEVMIARITEGLEKKLDPRQRLGPRRARRDLARRRTCGPSSNRSPNRSLTVLFVLVLCVFMLGQRDDLRNRLIRLVGTGNVTMTTRTLDEGAQPITRYLLDQTMINAGVRLASSASGCYFLGIPYAALWGAVAASPGSSRTSARSPRC